MKMNIYFSNLLVNSLYHWKIMQDNVSCVSIEAIYSGSTSSVMHASIPLQLVPGWKVRMLAMSGNTIKLIACSALLPPTPPPPTTTSTSHHQPPTTNHTDTNHFKSSFYSELYVYAMANCKCCCRCSFNTHTHTKTLIFAIHL